MGLTGKTKQVLDQRLTTLGLERMMRDPKTQRSFRVQKSLFTDEGMTGEDRVQWIFQVPHVLGHKALCLPERLRYPVLEAFSRAQLTPATLPMCGGLRSAGSRPTPYTATNWTALATRCAKLAKSFE